MPNTPNRNWPYPEKGEKPWFTPFEGFADAIDSDVQDNASDILTNAANIGNIQTYRPSEENNFTGAGPHEITADMSGSLITLDTHEGTLNLPSPDSGLCFFIAPTFDLVNDDYIVVDSAANGSGGITGSYLREYYPAIWTKMRLAGLSWVFLYAFSHDTKVGPMWYWYIWDGAGIIGDDNTAGALYAFDLDPAKHVFNSRREQVAQASYTMDFPSNPMIPSHWINLLGVTETVNNPVTITIDWDLIKIENWEVTIVDEGGNAAANNITIETEGSQTISGQVNWTIDGDYNAVTLYSDGSNLFVK